MDLRLNRCLMFLSGDSCEDEFPYLFMSKKHRVPTFGLVEVRAHNAIFLDQERGPIPPDQLQLRMWKYFQQNAAFRRRFMFQTRAITAAEPLPEPDIVDVDPPEGFWAFVSGTITEATHSGLRFNKNAGVITGYMPYIFTCQATELIVEVDPKNDLFDEDT